MKGLSSSKSSAFSIHLQLQLEMQMTPVGFEPTQLALVELEYTPLGHSGNVSVNAVPLC